MSSDISFKIPVSSRIEEKIFRTTNFTWTIDEFKSRFGETGQIITSSTLDADFDDKIKCNLEICQIFSKGKTKKYLSFYLCFEKLEKLPVPLTLKFYILRNNGKKKFVREIRKLHELKKFKYGFDRFVSIDQLYRNAGKFLPNNKLTVVCKISIESDSVSITSLSATTNLERYSINLLKDMRKMLESSELNLGNVCDFVEISEKYSAKALRECCIEAICMNISKVIESKIWAKIIAKYPLLPNEVLKFLNKKDKSVTSQENVQKEE